MFKERWLDKLNQRFGRYGVRNLMSLYTAVDQVLGGYNYE